MSDFERVNILGNSPIVPAPVGQAEVFLPYASITERFVALAIDYGVIFLPLEWVIWAVCKVAGAYLELWQLVGMLVAMNVMFVVYEAVFSSNGRVTLGKNLVGIAVVKKDKSGPISFARALLRAIGYYISAGLFFGGFVLAWADDKKRALHDYLGDSVVVQIRERSAWEVWMLRAVGAVLLAVFVSTVYQSFGGRNWQEKAKIRQARTFLENLALLEEGHYVRYGYYTNNLDRLALLSGDPVQFQRDMKQVFATGKNGIRIGVNDNVYKISALAQDKQRTPVYFTNKP